MAKTKQAEAEVVEKEEETVTTEEVKEESPPKTEETLEKRYSIEQTYNKNKFDKMKYAEAVLYVQDLDNLNVLFSTKTKAVLVKGLAEKLEYQKYPLHEIKKKISDDLKDAVSITDSYLGRCLDDKYKHPARVAAGKKNIEKAAHVKKSKQGKLQNKDNVHKAEMFETDEDEDREYEDSTNLQQVHGSSSSTSSSGIGAIAPELEKPEAPQGYTTEYIQNLEKENDLLQQRNQELEEQAKALNGQIPYLQMKQANRVNKLDKQMLIKLEEVTKKARKEVYLITDIRTRQVIQIFSDKDFNKQNQQSTK